MNCIQKCRHTNTYNTKSHHSNTGTCPPMIRPHPQQSNHTHSGWTTPTEMGTHHSERPCWSVRRWEHTTVKEHVGVYGDGNTPHSERTCWSVPQRWEHVPCCGYVCIFKQIIILTWYSGAFYWKVTEQRGTAGVAP